MAWIMHCAEWSSVLIDAKMITAFFDRLTRHCPIVETGNEFYRFQQTTTVAKKRVKVRAQNRKGAQAEPPE